MNIDSGNELDYYEDLEKLLESDEKLQSDELYQLLKEVDMNVFAGLIESYFDDLTDNIPSTATDFFTLITNMGLALKGMALNCDEDGTYLLLAEEIAKFNRWFMGEKTVTCINDKTGEKVEMTPCEAIATYRLEKINGDKFDYYFDKAMDYKLEDYVLSFKDLIV